MADSEGLESEVKMENLVEVGAFAKPEASKHHLQFIVNQPPYEAGVDPFAMLIDRMADDSVMKVTAQ